MKRGQLTRRLVVIGGGAGLLALACGGDDGVDETGAGGSTNAGGGGVGGSNVAGSGPGGSDAGGSAGTGGASACGAALVVMGSNYDTDPHDLTIPLSDLEAGVTKTYTTTGVSHTHSITLTEADFAALRNGETVKRYTCFDNPGNTDHEFVISCADPNAMPTFEGEIGTASNCPA